jgi:hypothetical protein
MLRQGMNALLMCVLMAATSFALCGCTRSPEESKRAEVQPRTETPATIATPSPRSSQSPQIVKDQTAKESPALPPKPDEVKEVVARVFGKAASPDTTHNPSFVVGDFNGDGSEDLAVEVKAGDGKLAEINNELANWILEDPRNVFIPGRDSAVRTPPNKPVRAEKGDTLLAIIHGVGARGWRNPEAKQVFLLKNGAGSDMTAQAAKSLRGSKEKQKLPPLKGDAIRQTIGGKPGLLVWTGAKYAWYSTIVE